MRPLFAVERATSSQCECPADRVNSASLRSAIGTRVGSTANQRSFRLATPSRLHPVKASAVLDSGPVVAKAPPARDRLDSVDLLRGIVMVVMALDHTRDFFHAGRLLGLDPLDLKTTTIALFLTRWITHFCAPVFIFLAGTGAFLSSTRGKSKRDLSWFLVTRGAWLIVLELTFIRWAGWTFSVDLHT